MPHRYFTAEVGNGRAALNGTDAHHLADVMRAKIGENVILCDAHAVEYVGTIISIQPGRVEFTVTEGYPSAAEPSVEVTLFAGYPKLGKLEDTIRHSVELGVTNVVPFFSRYCVAAPKKEEAKNERYCRVAVEAAKQCGRGILPTVELPLPDFNAVCDRFKDYDLVLFFYECGGVSLREVFNKEPGNRAKSRRSPSSPVPRAALPPRKPRWPPRPVLKQSASAPASSAVKLLPSPSSPPS